LKNAIILGAGITGLSAGFASSLPVYEASDFPGGICSSYHIRPGEKKRNTQLPADDEAYRFEIGGGHWIFGKDERVSGFLEKFVSLREYSRKSSVYFYREKRLVPYPIQNHLRFFDTVVVERATAEMIERQGKGSVCTMKDWLEHSFGPTLCDLFFYPFHELYTAGLYDRIAPQDEYKSPVDLKLVMQGALKDVSPVGYNATFIYPEGGLNLLSQRIAAQCNIRYDKQVVEIHVADREIIFGDGSIIPYDALISTLPLHAMIHMTDIDLSINADPHTSVLVLNIGALRGNKCPDDHWLYTPDTHSGFHRVGFYSNVDRSFLPLSARKRDNRVSIYVEKSFPGSVKPTDEAIDRYTEDVIRELQEWEFINDIEVVDPTWIDVGYTWSWPDSDWRNKAINALKTNEIYQVGRYGRWVFQGIADSIREGLTVGFRFK